MVKAVAHYLMNNTQIFLKKLVPYLISLAIDRPKRPNTKKKKNKIKKMYIKRKY